METAKGIKGFFQKIGKRNMIIVAVMLLVGVAVYLNYLWFYNPAIDDGNNTGDNSGIVDTGANATDYFAAATLSRENARNESLEVLQGVVDSAEGEEKEEALREISRIAQDMENEANIETLIKAKGYEQCVAVINGNSASVIVSSETSLDPAQVAAITTIVYEQSGILPENLTVAQK